jgi:hypothetical protein
MESNTTGYDNVAIGRNTLDANTTGYSNTAVGESALTSNTTGYRNVAIGQDSMIYCTEGLENTAVGQRAAHNITTGDYNVAIGQNAGSAITEGSSNIAIGVNALDACTTVSNNTAVGTNSLSALNTTSCTAIGYEAGKLTTGPYNVMLGTIAGHDNTSGQRNTFVGYDSGRICESGDFNVCVGFETATGDASVSNTIVIGHEISGNGNSFNFGKSRNVVTNVFTSNASFSRSSDLHKKTNIKSTDIGLSFINELNPVTFNWKDSSEWPEKYKDKDKAEMDTETNLYGMIAQEVKTALDKVGHENFGGWSKDEDGSERLSQEMFIYPLINAVKELSAEVERLKANSHPCKELHEFDAYPDLIKRIEELENK